MAIDIQEAYILRDQLARIKHSIELDMANGDPPNKKDVQLLFEIADEAIVTIMLECD